VPAREVLFDDAFPAGATNSNTTRNAADWVSDPMFGAKSGRRVLRQANTFFHQDNIQFRTQPRVPLGARWEAWVYVDPKQPPRAVAVQFAGGKKVWWGREADGAGVGGTRAGDLPAPGAWAKLALTADALGLKENTPVASLTLQEYGGVVSWDAAVFEGTSAPATDPRASLPGVVEGAEREDPTRLARRTERGRHRRTREEPRRG
jgi:hypothetical protein